MAVYLSADSALGLYFRACGVRGVSAGQLLGNGCVALSQSQRTGREGKGSIKTYQPGAGSLLVEPGGGANFECCVCKLTNSALN